MQKRGTPLVLMVGDFEKEPSQLSPRPTTAAPRAPAPATATLAVAPASAPPPHPTFASRSLRGRAVPHPAAPLGNARPPPHLY